MKRFFLLLISAFFGVLLANAQSGSMQFDGENRTYDYHRPAGYTAQQSYPLVISLHGASSNSFQQALYSEFNNVADTAGFIVVYPNGIGSTWNSSNGVIPGQSTADDVGFINALIDRLMSLYSIDARRVYTCGISNGGFMSYRLMCELSHRFAAMASVAGQLPDGIVPTCNPGRPIPVLHLHGTTDPIVAYNGAAGWLSVDSTISWWLDNNNCPTTPAFMSLPDLDPNDGTTVETYQYTGCDAGSEVMLYKIINGGHTWPGGFVVPFIGNTCKDIEGSVEIWKFFKRFVIPDSLIGMPESTFNQQNTRIFPNPFCDEFFIEIQSGNAGGFLTHPLNNSPYLSNHNYFQAIDAENLSLELVDPAGRKTGLVYELMGQSQESLRLKVNSPKIAHGLYFLRISLAGQPESVTGFRLFYQPQ